LRYIPHGKKKGEEEKSGNEKIISAGRGEEEGEEQCIFTPTICGGRERGGHISSFFSEKREGRESSTYLRADAE